MAKKKTRKATSKKKTTKDRTITKRTPQEGMAAKARPAQTGGATKARQARTAPAATRSSKAAAAVSRAAARVPSLRSEKRDAVEAAVHDQLLQDDRPADDVTRVMGADLHYTDIPIRNFLVAIHNRLAAGVPAYTFTYDQAFAQSALSASVALLMARIDARTT